MVPGNGTFCEPTLSDSPHTVDFNPLSSISSVAVEHSYTDEKLALSPKHTNESELRPAAEVFGFLLEKRRSISMTKGLSSSTPSPWGLNSSTSHVNGAPTTPSNTKRSSSHFSDLRPAETLDTPSTLGSILVDPPHTATILNHTRIPVLQGRLHEGSNTGQPTDMAIATRASRIPRERRNLPILSGRRASTSETYSSLVPLKEPVKPTLATAYRSGAVSSATKATNHPSAVASHLPPEVATLAPVPMRSAHRRSASYGSNRPIPREWDAGLDAIRMARVKGLKSSNVDKENIANTLDNAGMRLSPSFALM